MKKVLITLGFLIGGLTIFAQTPTVTYRVDDILPGGALDSVHTKLIANTALTISGNDTVITVSGEGMKLSFDDLFDIASSSSDGTVSNYLMVIKSPTSFKDTVTHSNLPTRQNAYGDDLTYGNYWRFGNVKTSGGNSYAISENWASERLNHSQLNNIATKLVNSFGGSKSDYILTTYDPEYTSLP